MTQTTTNSSTNATVGQPRLPQLVFASKRAQPVTAKDEKNSVELPVELLHNCLVQFSTWGDIAKLSCVQKGWSGLLMEAGDQDRDSKWELAQALLKGEAGLEQNFDLAFRLLNELANVEVNQENIPVAAAASGECFSPAMKALANCYFEGHGVKQNSNAGVEWLRAASTMAKDMDAAHELALVYEYGKHNTEIDPFKAFEWLSTAAEEGHVEAMAELGLCYELGCGVEQSDESAIDWYIKAANAGHTTSQFSVGECFEEARGVPQSDQDACLWYYKGAVEGDIDCKNALRRLEEIARIVVPGVRAILDV